LPRAAGAHRGHRPCTSFDETALFHLINAVRENGSALLITSRVWPAAWPVTLPDLASRLKAATVVEIAEPDEELLAQVMVKLFADRQVVNVDDRIIHWLVARMERSLAAAFAPSSPVWINWRWPGSKITRAMAAEVLAQMDPERTTRSVIVPSFLCYRR
jgi:chromosomal replication initiation ATPase DnaA